MDLEPTLAGLRDDLAKATALADDHTRDVAGRLLVALEPALRLRLVELLTGAAASLTAELDGDLVEVRMEGRDPVWWVQRRPSEDAVEPTLVLPDTEVEDAGTARITLRLPDGLKARADAAADAAGSSLNAWIGEAVRAHLTAPGRRTPGAPRTRTDRRITGWA